MESIKGKGVVVTGASRGIGKEIATALAREGANLVLAARGIEDLEKVAAEIAREHGVKVYAVRCDVARREDLEQLAKESVLKLGRVDALVNNAGVSSQSLFHKQSVDDIQKLLYTNFFGYIALTRLLINHMVDNGGGHVVNIVSGSTLIDPPPRTFIVYSSLKWAVKAFTKGLFGEMRDLGIKATAIFPGVTDTALTGELDARMIDASKLMGTEPIARAVVFALTQPANVCPTDISVINQHSVWKAPPGR